MSISVPLQNKLTLPFNDSTVIQTTIDNVMSCNISECIVVVGHYSGEVKKAISNDYHGKVKFVNNDPIEVGLSTSLLHGLKNISTDLALCVSADQPTISSETYNKLIKNSLQSDNPLKTISVLRRRKIGLLNSAEGLGMPFVASREYLIKYLKKENENLNPVLRKMFKDGFKFYGIREKNQLELVNINHYDDYKSLLDDF